MKDNKINQRLKQFNNGMNILIILIRNFRKRIK